MNNWFAAASAGILSIFGLGGGHLGASSTVNFNQGSTTHIERQLRTGSTTKPIVNISCISAGVAARESSIDGAVSSYTTAVNDAYTARASALASAYALSGNDAIRTAVKAAWKQFTSTVQGDRRAWQKSRENAWATFRTSVQACGPTAASVADTANAGSELSGQ